MPKLGKFATLAVVLVVVAVFSGGAYAISALLFQDQTELQVVPRAMVKTNLPFGEGNPLVLIGGGLVSQYYLNASHSQDATQPATFSIEIEVTKSSAATGSVLVSYLEQQSVTVQPGKSVNWSISFNPSQDAQGQFWVLWTVYMSV